MENWPDNFRCRISEKKRVVLYPKFGKIMRAARVRLKTTLIDDSVYRWNAYSQRKAAYLIALRADTADRVRRRTQLGSSFRSFAVEERSHTAFDPENADQMRLAKHTREAEPPARPWRNNKESGQIAISKRIGEVLEKE